MKLLNKYKNGNAEVSIFDDGTRIVDYPDHEKLNLEYPLSIDLCITKYCEVSCPYCYAGCTQEGKHADIMNLDFVDTMIAGEECAIGGGSVTTHPDLKPFLRKLKEKGIIANMTVSQPEFVEKVMLINELIDEDLIKGLGVSYKARFDLLWKNVAENDNAIIHLIAGVHGKDVFDYLSQFNCKILILGYKNLERGTKYREQDKDVDGKIEWLKNNLDKYIKKFKLISLDNLAIEQLEPQRIFTEKQWKTIYQGNDGETSFYIDAVNKTFHKSSLVKEGYPLKKSITEMFQIIKK